jgi:hypothetical protein
MGEALPSEWRKGLLTCIGVAGFEPTTSSSRSNRLCRLTSRPPRSGAFCCPWTSSGVSECVPVSSLSSSPVSIHVVRKEAAGPAGGVMEPKIRTVGSVTGRGFAVVTPAGPAVVGVVTGKERGAYLKQWSNSRCSVMDELYNSYYGMTMLFRQLAAVHCSIALISPVDACVPTRRRLGNWKFMPLRMSVLCGKNRGGADILTATYSMSLVFIAEVLQGKLE